MKGLKKAISVICLALLIILASVGVSISGGVAIPITRKKEDTPITIELVEVREKEFGIHSEEYKP